MRLSSILTVFYKTVFPAIWILGMGAGVIAVFLISAQPVPGQAVGPNPLANMRLVFLAVWIVGAIVLLWLALRVRTVWLDGDCLIARNYANEQRIPISAVLRVRETRTRNPKMIIVETDATGDLPEKVVFIAQFGFQTRSTGHPTVKQLLDLAEEAREKPEGNDYPPPAPASDIRW